MAFFGELYLRSTLPFLSDEMTAREVRYLAGAFAGSNGLVADLGCGHGRHASALGEQLGHRIVGVELDSLSLDERVRGFPVVRADLFQLPFSAENLGGAYAWYASLFGFDDDRQLPLLREISRCLRPGALLVLETTPLERASSRPAARFDGVLPGGARLVEHCQYSFLRRRDELMRRLTFPDGRVLSASFFVRYYSVEELGELLRDANLSIRWAHGDLSGAPLSSSSVQLIIGAQRDHD